jgi:dCMP deaminase
MKITYDLINEKGEVTGGIFGEPFDDFVPPNWDVYFMRLSYECAAKSKDPSTKFGAVFVRNNQPIVFGFNGIPEGVEDRFERLQKPEKYDWVVHAETNGIGGAAKEGIATKNSTMYVSAWPCAPCAGLMVRSGVKKVVLHDPAVQVFKKVSPKWNNRIPETIFKEAGVEVVYLKGFVDRYAYLGGHRYAL